MHDKAKTCEGCADRCVGCRSTCVGWLLRELEKSERYKARDAHRDTFYSSSMAEKAMKRKGKYHKNAGV